MLYGVSMTQLNCKNCGKAIYRKPSEIKRSKSKNFFCSRSCSSTFNNSASPKRQKRSRVCRTCLGKFYGKTKYCSESCIPRKTETEKRVEHASRVTQLRRAMKEKAVKMLGGQCSICGYNKCNKALQFHHLDPNEKEFRISNASSWKKAKVELEKCILVCANCHAEIHDDMVRSP
jgi:hypothetical protein